MSPHLAVQVYARCFRKEHRHSSCRITLTHHAMVQTLVGASVCARTRKGCRFRSSALFVVFANGKMDRYPILGYCAGYCTGFRDVRCKFTATDTDTDILRIGVSVSVSVPRSRVQKTDTDTDISIRRVRPTDTDTDILILRVRVRSRSHSPVSVRRTRTYVRVRLEP